MNEKETPYLEGWLAFQVKKENLSWVLIQGIVKGDIVLLSERDSAFGYIKVGSGKVFFHEGSWVLKSPLDVYSVFTLEDFYMLLVRLRKEGQSCYQYSSHTLIFTNTIPSGRFLTC